MNAGKLRRSINVVPSDSRVEIRHPLWAVSLPKGWVDDAPGVRSLLERRVSAYEIAGIDSQVDALIALLRYEGGLAFSDTEPAYTLRQIREIFVPLILEWYGHYYSHPIWNMLRAGTLGQSGLIAWIVHNYHMSRSVGMTAARAATHYSKPSLKRIFLKSALDEYAHCEEYYLAQHAGLDLTSQDLQRYLPLPASLAFDLQMLRIAEEDWLAHVLVGLMQEFTARFVSHYEAFYQDVASAYGLGNFFDRWLAHTRLDLNYGHAEDFSLALDSDEEIAREPLERSLHNTWCVYQYLYTALDEAVLAGEVGGALRLPDLVGKDSPEPRTTFLYGVDADLPRILSARTYAELNSALSVGRFPAIRMAGHIIRDLEFMRNDLGRSVVRALSTSSTHSDVLMFGRLLESWTNPETEDPLSLVGDSYIGDPAPGALAICNLVRESASFPVTCAALLLLIETEMTNPEAGAERQPALPIGAHGILEENLSRRPISETSRTECAIVLLQLRELIESWVAATAPSIKSYYGE